MRQVRMLLCGFLLSLVACGGSSNSPVVTPVINVTPLSAGQIVFDSDRTGNFEIFVMQTDGSAVRQLTANTTFDSWWPRISPDRKRILFYRTPKGVHDTDYSQTSLWAMNADGSAVTLLRDRGTDGWVLQGHGEWSPDGTQLTMFGGAVANPQIYVTRADGTQPRRVTDGLGFWVDPSWSPNGSRLAFAGCVTTPCPVANFEIYTAAADGTGAPTRVTNDAIRDNDPYYSPDGSKIAWLSETQAPSSSFPVGVWNIRIAAPDGAALAGVTNDTNVNSKPDWSLDGTHIFFHRLVYGTPGGFTIYSIQPNGAGMAQLNGQIGNNEFPAN